VIIALGEVVVAIGLPVVQGLEAGDGIPGRTVMALAASGVFAGLLWWAYFDRVQPAFEHRAETTPASDRGRFARDVYTYAHAPIVAGIILAAVAMEEMALHPTDPLPAAFRAMGAAGIFLYFTGVGIGVFRSFGVVARERLAAVAVIGLLMLVADDLDGVVLLILVDLILLVTLVVEHLRIEGPRASAASVDDGRVVDDAAQ